ncbi:hypothetical protein LV35_04254 [Acinetobacter baumannii]|uniref:Uncharacterized protein n=1 Tax=Acinetobacter baumannii TaxID=470 RepID=A0AAJ0QT02_ACIBA|nr:hypothetical protein LV35_04254 [Acinetobacter baumannii]
MIEFDKLTVGQKCGQRLLNAGQPREQGVCNESDGLLLNARAPRGGLFRIADHVRRDAEPHRDLRALESPRFEERRLIRGDGDRLPLDARGHHRGQAPTMVALNPLLLGLFNLIRGEIGVASQDAAGICRVTEPRQAVPFGRQAQADRGGGFFDGRHAHHASRDGIALDVHDAVVVDDFSVDAVDRLQPAVALRGGDVDAVRVNRHDRRRPPVRAPGGDVAEGVTGDREGLHQHPQPVEPSQPRIGGGCEKLGLRVDRDANIALLAVGVDAQ